MAYKWGKEIPVSIGTGYTQENRRIAIYTPLGEDVLLLHAFSGREDISQLFQFDLESISENDAIDFKDIVGQNVTLQIILADGSPRYWNGFISRFFQGARSENLASYHAEMVPWLWFLTRTTDCRIFQKQKVPDIIQQIFKDLGFKDFELRLYGDFVEREYCVQYRESYFNFVSRLMEEEGIYYFFEHEENKHTLVLANDPAAHKPCPEQTSARYELNKGLWQEEDVVLEWRQEQELRPGRYTLTDYNFETPSTDLAVSVSGQSPFEIYDYPGEYRKRSEGEGLARIRLQEQEKTRIVVHGSSSCRAFGPGYHFDLTDHYRSDLDQAYLLTSVYHQASQGGDYRSGSLGSNDSDFTYVNRFECIPYSTIFRPARVTPQPVIQGCQTAIVVGPSGEEIHTDKHGRVKVQFHWDREHHRDENSSCWIRVSHPWAGKGWGSVSIPRIGQEVIVDFLDGDPDQPIITGRVYNAELMPPYELPSGGVVSGLKSNTHKGKGYNEISMNDTAKKEMITVHGQYDMSTTVEHDDTQTVHNNRSITVDGTHSETVKGAVTETYNDKHAETVKGAVTETYNDTHTETVTGSVTEQYKANQTTTVHQDIVITSETAHIYIHTATNIHLHVGASMLWMASDGNIELKGVNVAITASDTVTIKGQKVHSEATAEHQTKGAIVLSDGSATNTVKGGMVMLNP
jgi:type VI secretion system secreted protein VgrG